jgi:hypothetical protein
MGSRAIDTALIIPSVKLDRMDDLAAGIEGQMHTATWTFIPKNHMQRNSNFACLEHETNLFLDLTHVRVILLSDRFLVKVNDDTILIGMTGINRSVIIATTRNIMIGSDIVALTRRVVDPISRLGLFEISPGEIMNNFQSYALIHEEDIAISIVNAIQCSTQHIISTFNIAKHSHSQRWISTDAV